MFATDSNVWPPPLHRNKQFPPTLAETQTMPGASKRREQIIRELKKRARKLRKGRKHTQLAENLYIQMETDDEDEVNMPNQSNTKEESDIPNNGTTTFQLHTANQSKEEISL